jgi:aminodeoxyfutalosine deaminase
VGDICNNILTIAQKTKGRLRYHNFIEASGFLEAVAETRFQRAVEIYSAYKASLPHNSIVPHAAYSVSPQLFAMINDLPDNHLLTIHNQEVAAENELFENGTGDFLRMYAAMGIDVNGFTPPGKSSLQSVLPYFTKNQTLILVHNVCSSEKDIEFAKQTTNNEQRSTFFCLCPNANLYISNMLPDVNRLMQHTDDIVLGTDSLASNDTLSILEEIKILQRHFPNLQLAHLLKWATSNGAKALAMDNELGSFEKGKKPGIVLIEGLGNRQLTLTSSPKRIL